MGKYVQQHADGDVTEEFAQKYRDMIPVEVVGVYSPDKLNCDVGPTGGPWNHLYTVVTTDDQFYVGITGREPVKRWKEHLGKGFYSGAEYLEDKEIAAFILVRTRLRYAEDAENRLTAALKTKYGRNNVSGGDYAKGEHPRVGPDVRPISNTSPFSDKGHNRELKSISLFPTESQHIKSKSQLNKSDIKPTVGHKLVILCTALWFGLFIGEQMPDVVTNSIIVIAWLGVPIGIYLDNRKQPAEWPIWWWSYALFALIPVLSFIPGLAYLYRRHKLIK